MFGHLLIALNALLLQGFKNILITFQKWLSFYLNLYALVFDFLTFLKMCTRRQEPNGRVYN